jgi:hypothetical protein
MRMRTERTGWWTMTRQQPQTMMQTTVTYLPVAMAAL